MAPEPAWQPHSHAGAWRSQGTPWGTGSVCMKQPPGRPALVGETRSMTQTETHTDNTHEALLAVIEALQTRLAEAEDTLRALAQGDVDAVVIPAATGRQVYTLTGADEVYRRLINGMAEGALT